MSSLCCAYEYGLVVQSSYCEPRASVSFFATTSEKLPCPLPYVPSLLLAPPPSVLLVYLPCTHCCVLVPVCSIRTLCGLTSSSSKYITVFCVRVFVHTRGYMTHLTDFLGTAVRCTPTGAAAAAVAAVVRVAAIHTR